MFDTPRPLPPHRIWARGGDRPVLALHCSLAHSGAWSGLAEALHGVTITACDQMGHGRGPDWDGRADLHAEALQDAVAMAEEIGQGGKVDVFGHSFGGTVGLRLALERPDLVRSLMLVEPVLFAAARAAQAEEWGPFEASHREVVELVATGNSTEAARIFHGFWGTGEPLSALPERARSYITDRIHLIPAQNHVLLEDAPGLLRPGGLESIRVPVLLVEGNLSPPAIGAVNRALAARLPKSHRMTVPEAGHMLPITHPLQLAELVAAHLASS